MALALIIAVERGKEDWGLDWTGNWQEIGIKAGSWMINSVLKVGFFFLFPPISLLSSSLGSVS